MQWISSDGASRIDDIVLERSDVLREQMTCVIDEPVGVTFDDED
jgi:hypothetical protein